MGLLCASVQVQPGTPKPLCTAFKTAGIKVGIGDSLMEETPWEARKGTAGSCQHLEGGGAEEGAALVGCPTRAQGEARWEAATTVCLSGWS